MKKTYIVSLAVSAVIVLLSSISVEAASPKKSFSIKGEVVSATDGKPVDFASVVVIPSRLYAMTDNDGRFSIAYIVK